LVILGGRLRIIPWWKKTPAVKHVILGKSGSYSKHRPICI
jgi:hypothetical protein